MRIEMRKHREILRLRYECGWSIDTAHLGGYHPQIESSQNSGPLSLYRQISIVLNLTINDLIDSLRHLSIATGLKLRPGIRYAIKYRVETGRYFR